MDKSEVRRRLEDVICSSSPAVGLAVSVLEGDARPGEVRRVAERFGVEAAEVARRWAYVHRNQPMQRVDRLDGR